MITTSEIYHDRIEAGLTPEQIRGRFEEMVVHLEQAFAETERTYKGTVRELATSNLGYILGYFGTEVREEWYGALPDVSHPVFGAGFGRGEDPTPKEAFEMGRKMGEASKGGISPEEAEAEAACDCTVGREENHVCAVHGRLGG